MATWGDPWGRARIGSRIRRASGRELGSDEAKLPIRLDHEAAQAGRFYQAELWTSVGPGGERQRWEGETSYATDRRKPAFAVASCVTELTAGGRAASSGDGVHAAFALAAPHGGIGPPGR